MRRKTKRTPFTAKEIKNIVDLWPYHSIMEISKMTKRNYYSILDLADRIRERGYELPRKAPKEQFSNKIKNALGDVPKAK